MANKHRGKTQTRCRGFFLRFAIELIAVNHVCVSCLIKSMAVLSHRCQCSEYTIQKFTKNSISSGAQVDSVISGRLFACVFAGQQSREVVLVTVAAAVHELLALAGQLVVIEARNGRPTDAGVAGLLALVGGRVCGINVI